MQSKMRSKKNNNWIGIVILAVGVLAILFVGYAAYQKGSFSSQEEEVKKRDADLFKKSGSTNRAASKGNKKEKKKAYSRQNSISYKEISGLWQAQLKSDGSRALLEIKKGTYRLVIIKSENSPVRYYSNGSYTITGDLIMLSPYKKQSPPQMEGHNYRVLTVSNIPVVASKYKGKLIWQIPPKEVRVYVPPYHAILDLAKDNIAVWSVLE